MLRVRYTSSWKLFEFSENFTQLKCGASSLQVLDKFSQNFANGFLKLKNPKVRGYFQIPKIFGILNFDNSLCKSALLLNNSTCQAPLSVFLWSCLSWFAVHSLVAHQLSYRCPPNCP